MTVFFRLFLSIIVAVPRVQSQALKCNDSSCVGHARDVTVLDRSTSTTVWIAPDDVIVDRIPEENAFPCPGSNLVAVVKQALQLTTRQVILRPFCLEGLILVKNPVSVLVDLKGPTYCALVVSTADQLRIRDIVFDHGECIKATARGTLAIPTAEATAAIVLHPQSGTRRYSWTALRLPDFGDASRGCGSLLLWWQVGW